MFNDKTRLGKNFYFKDRIPKDLTSGVVYKFQRGLCNESYYGKLLCSSFSDFKKIFVKLKGRDSSFKSLIKESCTLRI